MSDADSITYRSLPNQSSRVWHFVTDCPDWPQGSLGYIQQTCQQHDIFKGDPVNPRVTRPLDGTVCTQCLDKWDNGTGQGTTS